MGRSAYRRRSQTCGRPARAAPMKVSNRKTAPLPPPAPAPAPPAPAPPPLLAPGDDSHHAEGLALPRSAGQPYIPFHESSRPATPPENTLPLPPPSNAATWHHNSQLTTTTTTTTTTNTSPQDEGRAAQDPLGSKFAAAIKPRQGAHLVPLPPPLLPLYSTTLLHHPHHPTTSRFHHSTRPGRGGCEQHPDGEAGGRGGEPLAP